MIDCIKTGAQAFLPEYGQYIYGDAFELEIDGGPGELRFVLIFRACEVDFKPINFPRKHFTVERITHWFDQEHTSQSHNSTLIAEMYSNHGYEGVPT